LLGLVLAYLNERGWGKTVDSGWEDWDLEIYCHPWTVVQVCTAQEEHGGGKRLIRVRYRLRPRGSTKALAVVGVLTACAAAVLQAWPAAAVGGVLLAASFGAWWRGTGRASRALALFDAYAAELGLIRCEPAPVGQESRVMDRSAPNDHSEGGVRSR
jgi:hypothetical protein